MALTLTPEIETRVLAEAARRNQPPEAVIEAALKALSREAPTPDASRKGTADGEEKRMRDLLAAVQEQARLLPPVPPEQTETGSAPEEQAFGKIIAEKFRKQGFNV